MEERRVPKPLACRFESCQGYVTQRQLMFSVTLADCEVQTFRSGGPGGQNQNKRDTGVRIIHHPSGARGECREERSQFENKKRAFRKMANSPMFTAWVARQSHEYKKMEARVQTWVAQQMEDETLLKVEVFDKGRWRKEV